MKYPKTIRYWTSMRSAGNSFYVLIPLLIRELMGLEHNVLITFTYDTKKKTITIRRAK